MDSGGVGGGPTHLRQLVEGLTAAGHEVHAAIPGGGPLAGDLAAIQAQVHPVEFPHRPDPAVLLDLRRLIRRIGPQVVHTHGGFAGLWLRMAAWGLPCRIVHTYHGIHYLRFPHRLARVAASLLDRFMLTLTDRTICVSDRDHRDGRACGVVEPDGSIILNGLDPHWLAPGPERARARNDLGLPDESPLIGCVGRFHLQKGHVHLLAAMDRLDPRVELVLVGEGPLEGELRAKAARMRHRVHFLSARTPLRDFYGAIDVFCLPSLWEGLPYTLLEALATDLPIVATQGPGNDEVLDGLRWAQQVPPGHPRALSRALQRSLDRAKGGRTGLIGCDHEGTDRIRTRFMVEDMIQKVIAVYEEISEPQRGRIGKAPVVPPRDWG